MRPSNQVTPNAKDDECMLEISDRRQRHVEDDIVSRQIGGHVEVTYRTY